MIKPVNFKELKVHSGEGPRNSFEIGPEIKRIDKAKRNHSGQAT